VESGRSVWIVRAGKDGLWDSPAGICGSSAGIREYFISPAYASSHHSALIEFGNFPAAPHRKGAIPDFRLVYDTKVSAALHRSCFANRLQQAERLDFPVRLGRRLSRRMRERLDALVESCANALRSHSRHALTWTQDRSRSECLRNNAGLDGSEKTLCY